MTEKLQTTLSQMQLYIPVNTQNMSTVNTTKFSQ